MVRILCLLVTSLVLFTAAAAHADSWLNGIWKGSIYIMDSGGAALNVQLEIRQDRGRAAFKGTAISCDQSATPGCPAGASNANTTRLQGTLIPDSTSRALTVEIELPGSGGSCTPFLSADGTVKSDGKVLTLMVRGQNPDCNPILGLLNVERH